MVIIHVVCGEISVKFYSRKRKRVFYWLNALTLWSPPGSAFCLLPLGEGRGAGEAATVSSGAVKPPPCQAHDPVVSSFPRSVPAAPDPTGVPSFSHSPRCLRRPGGVEVPGDCALYVSTPLLRRADRVGHGRG